MTLRKSLRGKRFLEKPEYIKKKGGVEPVEEKVDEKPVTPKKEVKSGRKNRKK